MTTHSLSPADSAPDSITALHSARATSTEAKPDKVGKKPLSSKLEKTEGRPIQWQTNDLNQYKKLQI